VLSQQCTADADKEQTTAFGLVYHISRVFTQLCCSVGEQLKEAMTATCGQSV